MAPKMGSRRIRYHHPLYPASCRRRAVTARPGMKVSRAYSGEKNSQLVSQSGISRKYP